MVSTGVIIAGDFGMCEPSIAISKEIVNTGDAPYNSGDVIQYRITLTNTGGLAT